MTHDGAAALQELRRPHCDERAAASLASAARAMRAAATGGAAAASDASLAPFAPFDPLPLECPLYARKFNASVLAEEFPFFRNCSMLGYGQECLARATFAAVATGD
jgi:hypothetical protein